MTMDGYLQLGWKKSCVDVKVGEHSAIPWPKYNWSGACAKYCSVAVLCGAKCISLNGITGCVQGRTVLR